MSGTLYDLSKKLYFNIRGDIHLIDIVDVSNGIDVSNDIDLSDNCLLFYIVLNCSKALFENHNQ